MTPLNAGRLAAAVAAYDSCKAFRRLLEERDRELQQALAKLTEAEQAAYWKHVSGELDLMALLTNGTFRRRGE